MTTTQNDSTPGAHRPDRVSAPAPTAEAALFNAPKTHRGEVPRSEGLANAARWSREAEEVRSGRGTRA